MHHPVEVARAVMNQFRHNFLVRPATDEFAGVSGIDLVSKSYFAMNAQKARWEGVKHGGGHSGR